jgi:hypothetical protein
MSAIAGRWTGSSSPMSRILNSSERTR